MSIPPLVCSTPPPPDQCEDEKDHEDFDIQYNLSQDDDDDENYEYENFSTYNNHQSTNDIKQFDNITTVKQVSQVVDESHSINPDQNKCEQSKEDVPTSNGESEIFTNIQGEINIEDLNLSLEQENIENTNIDDCKESYANALDLKQDTKIDTPDDTNIQLNESAHTEDNEYDDDFGDFNDFKSSAVETVPTVEREPVEECYFPAFNLQSAENDSQINESINNVLSSIFEHDITEPEGEFNVKLESLLSETWGHILETEVRQPYMVNWNNSLGQKTLLKALCIDSRNILFGPKWSYNMPKYAVNLSTAPLQPQKQLSSPTTLQPDTVNTDKVASNKATTSWIDPFSSEGQESCNTESAENPVIETGPTDLDVFESTIPAKSDKIYSSTISVQPLRQINLPDTHIFTPTDSETPRSKTIHYENSPAVLLPQSLIENTNNQSEEITSPTCNNTVKELDDNEYWEFQNFKGTSDSLPHNSEITQSLDKTKSLPSVSTATVNHGTQLLQPIKLEPIIPTLNWPDPGEVKETFDDFSEFVSSTNENLDVPTTTSWSNEKSYQDTTFASPWSNEILTFPTTWTNEKQVLPSTSTTQNDVSLPVTNNKSSATTEIVSEINVETEASPSNDSFEDEFDTFQSALPSKMVSDSQDEMTSPAGPLFIDYNAFLKVDNSKSDCIKGHAIPNEVPFIEPNHNNGLNTQIPTTTKAIDQSSSLHCNLLQPTPIICNVSAQQKSGQILQPLSLESYSQINWPNPGIDLQDLSRFNPVESLQSLKSDLNTNSHSKVGSPVHNAKGTVNSQADDEWGEFVSSKPKQQPASSKKSPVIADDDEWTDFVSSPSLKPQNGLNTISLNVHTNLNIQKSSNSKFSMKNNLLPLDIPTLNYITPKSSNHKSYSDRHFQNL